MAAIMHDMVIGLSDREALALGCLRGRVVECLCGEIWLTVDGEGRDAILGCGQTWHVESDSRVVVSAFGPSQFRIRKPLRARGLAYALQTAASLLRAK